MENGLPSLLLIGLLAGLPAWAWGRQGHAEIARLAEFRLRPSTLAAVHRLLRNDLDAQGRPSGRRDLASIASWADEIRDLAPEGVYKGWHSRANPVCGHALAKCREGHCVDALIERFSRVLQDRKQPDRERNEALKWLVHLVGDLHQPLHSGVARDGGHTPVRSLGGRLLKPGATLHSVWDRDLARLALKGWQAPAELPGGESGSSEDWMIESRDLALEHVYRPLPGFTCEGSLPAEVSLDQAYVEQALPVIRQQILRAAVRLARRLEQLLS